MLIELLVNGTSVLRRISGKGLGDPLPELDGKPATDSLKGWSGRYATNHQFREAMMRRTFRRLRGLFRGAADHDRVRRYCPASAVQVALLVSWMRCARGDIPRALTVYGARRIGWASAMSVAFVPEQERTPPMPLDKLIDLLAEAAVRKLTQEREKQDATSDAMWVIWRRSMNKIRRFLAPTSIFSLPRLTTSPGK